VVREHAASMGILAVEGGAFAAALESQIGDWDKSLPVLASGMITSRQGWIELPYVDCPAGAAELARALFRHEASGRVIHFSTGLHLAGGALGHDVMRSEETQVLGALGEGQHFITPGTHSKWIDVADDRIVNFATYVTGETFAALRQHTILARLMTGDTHNEVAFANGVERALADPSGLLHALFSVRSLGLFGEIDGAALSSYLSGLVIGTEVAHALPLRNPAADYVVLASPGIAQRYLKALNIAGVKARLGDPLAIVLGLRKIGKEAGVL
jgi:2-dehydro-3-deoxygalactonokinase